jgi:transcription initiation factor TFIIIB Brf1 subunit/transcription initiation factor TFIIB
MTPYQNRFETATEYAREEAHQRYSRELDEYRKAYERQLMNAKNISTAAFRVGLLICLYEGCPTDIGRMAKEAGVTRREVIRAIKWLERRGHIERLDGLNPPYYFSFVRGRLPPSYYVELPTAIH